MKPAGLADCLETHFTRVLDHERPQRNGTKLFAVFADSVEEGPFCGLATADDIVEHPDWIFADLVEHRKIHAVSLDTPIRDALLTLDKQALDALPVLDANGRFQGAVTRTSILLCLLAREEKLLRETRRLNKAIERDRKQLSFWSSRLSELHEASRTLLGVLAHTSLEADLLQHGIEALTHLLQAKYGAIGILGEKGELQHFHHAGITPEEVTKIAHFPEGKGLLGAVIKEDRAIRLDDIGQDPRSAGFPEGHPSMKSLLAVPISQLGHVFGRIYVCDKLDGTGFTLDDELLAKSFSNSLSLVLENAREMMEMKQAQQRLDYLAHFDTLTGLPNRELLTDRIQQVIAHSQRYKRKMALMFVDIDNFKTINDLFGHGMGDELLKSVASIISGSLRQGDTVARLSGDEFIVLLPEIDFAQDVASVAEKIVNTLKEPIRLGEASHEIFITVSIGISLYPQDGSDMESLMAKADTAMYHAKSAGKNTFQFFTSSLNETIQLHLKLEQLLRKALSRKELSLHYQPQIDLETGKIIGTEALLRWHNREIGNISPAQFIPVAEETGLIVQIGAWALRTACAQAAKWQTEGHCIHMAVNISPKQFQHDHHFLRTLQSALHETGLDPNLLELEITESMMMQKIDATIEMLGMIKNLGVRFSMDDFGTGFSSLGYLKKLPIDIVKIDQSFVRDIATDRNDAAIVAAITAMARQLELKVIAEGVETKEQLEFIRAHQCDAVQGYYFSRPVAENEMSALLERGISSP